MILTRERILAEVQFEPALDEFQVNPMSIDLRLEQGFVMPGYGFMMFKSMEKVTLPNDVMGVVYPRSSTNRRGLTLSMTGIVDPGYSGQLTLPIRNETSEDIILLRGERVASIGFHRLEEHVVARKSKYHDSSGEYVPDKDEELKFLRDGDIKGLKKKYFL